MRFMKKATSLVLGATVLSSMLITEAQAVPAFARQTGMACVSCHSNSFPALNSFGRSFKAQGYTMRGAAPLVEGENLSIPADLKASVITKLRYQMRDSQDRGEIQWPDEAALLIGGRAAENIGFLLEAGLGPQEGHTDLTTGETETAGNFLSYKAQFNVTDSFGVVVFGTDGLGVGYGMELMNTAAARSQRPIENRSGFSAFQRLGIGSGTATGIAAVYHTGNLMVNYSHWAPTWGNVNADIFGGLAHYLRVNYFMNAGGWDMGFGLSYMGGTVESGATNDVTEKHTVEATAIDFQALGSLGGMPAEFYVSYGDAPKSDATDEVMVFNNKDGVNNDFNKSAYGLLGKLYVIPKAAVYVAYGSSSNSANADDITDTTIGFEYMLAQNSKLEVFNVSNDDKNDTTGKNDYTMINLFSGF